jgi:hypothetical protein
LHRLLRKAAHGLCECYFDKYKVKKFHANYLKFNHFVCPNRDLVPNFTPERPDQMSTIAELGHLSQPYMNWGYCLDFQVCISILKSDMAWRDSGMAISDILHLVPDLSQAGLGRVGVIDETGPH